MPKAETTSTTPTREAALRLSAAPVIASVEPGHPDAALLALHQEFLVYEAVLEDWNVDRVEYHVGEAAHAEWWKCVRAMLDIVPTTPEGIRAKAECAYLAVESCGDPNGDGDVLARQVLAQIAGRTT